MLAWLHIETRSTYDCRTTVILAKRHCSGTNGNGSVVSILSCTLRAIAELGARYHRDELLLMVQGIEQLSRRMSTTLPERQVLEDAFREMIV